MLNTTGITQVIKRISSIPLLLAVMAMGFSTPADAQLVSQITAANGICGGDLQKYGTCKAGEISIASVVDIVFAGNPTECVIGDPLTIQSATVNYTIKTQERADLIMYIADQEGVDPREATGAGQSCSAYSLPSPFATPTTVAQPFGDVDGDQCGDLGTSVPSASRSFTNLTFSCQDNDVNGKADAQILLVWNVANNSDACGTGTGQSFPTAGPPSKCDYDITNSNLDIVYKPRLTLVKQVTNNSGGLALPSAWTLSATGPTPISGATGSGAVTDAEVGAGAYTLGETGPSGYTGTWQCTGGGTLLNGVVTLANANPAQSTTCTITNDDQPAILTLVKSLPNDSGSSSVPGDWTLIATGPTSFQGAGGTAAVQNQPVNAGTYTLTETGPLGFNRGPWSCKDTATGQIDYPVNPQSQVSLANGNNVTCTIINDDLPATLTLIKTIDNSDGGTALATDWTLSATGPTNISGATGSGTVTGATVNSGLYTLAESGPIGYTASLWSCQGSGPNYNFVPATATLTLGNGGTATCTINNDDIATTLSLSKVVNNPNGGNNAANTFPLTLTGTDGVHNSGVDYFSGDTPTVVPGVQYTVSETPPTGYQLSGIVCTDGSGPVTNPFTLSAGQNVSCVATNVDIAPVLTIVKNVRTGDEPVGSFTLHLTGAGGLCGQDGTADYTSGATPAVESNCAYTLTEDPFPDYAAGTVSCVDDDTQNPVNHPVTMSEGQNVTCTLPNDLVAPGTVRLVKQVNNNWNGPDADTDFLLSIAGTGGAGCADNDASDIPTGTEIDLTTGCTYLVGETSRPGYTQASITCLDEGGADAGNPFTATGGEGESYVCTIVNNDQAAQLALVKTVTGAAAPTEWLLSATGGNQSPSGQGGFTLTNVDAGNWDLSETGGPGGYSPGAWSCVDGAGANFPLFDADTVTLANGDIVTCTINNTEAAATLTLSKVVNNTNGGSNAANTFPLTLTGNDGVHDSGVDYFSGGTQPTVISAVQYTVSETPPAGYQLADPGGIVCTDLDNAQNSPAGTTFTLSPGQNVSCVFTNEDIAPTLTLVKEVIKDNGGNAEANAFTLTLQGIDGVHDTAQQYSTGEQPAVWGNVEYTMDELDNIPGYENTGVACVDNDDIANNPVVTDGKFTLELAQDVTCTLTNDDVAPSLTLFKDVTNDNAGNLGADAFDLVLTGVDSVHDAGVVYKSGDSPVVVAGVQYEVSENPQEGYTLTGIQCELVVDGGDNQPLPNPFTALLGQEISCTVSNSDVEPLAVFWVTKDFTDDNPSKVQVAVDCNDGSYAPETGSIAEGETKGFVVSQYSPGGMDCWVDESSSPDGYVTTYTAGLGANGDAESISDTEERPGCYFENVVSGWFTCHIVNTPAPVEVAVTKVWDVINTGGDYVSRDVRITVVCDSEMSPYDKEEEGNWYYNKQIDDGMYVGDQYTVTVQVVPDYPSTFCYAEEDDISSAVEVSGDCGSEQAPGMEVSAGSGASCTITNTVFFEGIPTLNQFGLAIMALLMLGVGMVGFRRFA